MTTTETQTSRLDIAQVLGGIGRVLRQDFLGLAVLALVLYGLPALLIGWYQVNALRSGNMLATLWVALPSMLISALLAGAVVRKALATATGEASTIADSLKTALPALLPILGATILIAFGVAAGMILLVVPGLMLACRWAVTVPAVVAERLGPLAAMKQSAQLTRGARWAIFGLFVLYFVAVTAVSMVTSVVTTGALTSNYADASWLYLAISAVTGSLMALVSSVAVAVIYLELRRSRGEAESLADVFA
jgi:hypothetical protein